MGSINGSYYPDTSASAALETELANMASAEDDRFSALTSSSAVKSYRPATSTALAALTGMSLGDIAIQTDTAITYRYDGSAWVAWEIAPTAFTPTWTALTVGNGTNIGTYALSGGIATLNISLNFGSTTSVSGTFYPNIPAAVAGPAGVGSCWAFDASAAAWATGVFVPSSYLLFATARASASVPWGWAVNDLLRISITYTTT